MVRGVEEDYFRLDRQGGMTAQEISELRCEQPEGTSHTRTEGMKDPIVFLYFKSFWGKKGVSVAEALPVKGR